MNRCFTIGALLLFVAADTAHADKLVRIAGGGSEQNNVPATQAKLNQPFGIDFDKAGNYYLVELAGGHVFKVDPKGTLTILGGTGVKGNSGDGGPALTATFNGMHSLAVTPGGILYAADTWNNRVRKIDPKSGTIEAFAGIGPGKTPFSGEGPAKDVQLGGIYCIAFNSDFSRLYLTDLDQRRIHYVDMKTNKLQGPLPFWGHAAEA
jgi:DNA-binding beta-propeller fold protein YncE